jgi:E3 ubiquitin-protein ligase UBR2
MVLCGFIQQSTVLSKVDRTSRGTYLDADYAVPGYEPAVLSSRLEVGPHVSSCGHVLHAECWRKQYEETVKKENRRPAR